MTGKQSCCWNEHIIVELLKLDDALPEQTLQQLPRNELVHLGRDKGVIDEKQFLASLRVDNFVVKSYLWSFLDDPCHRERVCEYVICCTKLQHRAYLTLKTTYFDCLTGRLGPKYTIEAFIAALLTKDAFAYLVLPEHCTTAVAKHPLKPFVDATRQRHPELLEFADVNALEALITRTGFDNAKKYIATKVKTAVFNHVFVHLHRRVKGSLEARRRKSTSSVPGMMELYDTGVTDKTVEAEDCEIVIGLRKVFMKDTEAAGAVQIPDASVTPKHAEFLLHLECCRLAEETPRAFTPFPNPSLGRCYQRLCMRLFCKLLKVEESQENIQVALNMAPSLARARGKKMQSARKAKRKARKGKQGSRGRPKQNGYFNWRKGQRDIL